MERYIATIGFMWAIHFSAVFFMLIALVSISQLILIIYHHLQIMKRMNFSTNKMMVSKNGRRWFSHSIKITTSHLFFISFLIAPPFILFQVSIYQMQFPTFSIPNLVPLFPIDIMITLSPTLTLILTFHCKCLLLDLRYQPTRNSNHLFPQFFRIQLIYTSDAALLCFPHQSSPQTKRS